VLYYACRDRHCPRCQRKASEAWCERQKAAVLPVTYYHLVFTLPHVLDPWVQRYPQVIYALLFETVWATLSAFGADPKRLGGQLGMTAVLLHLGPDVDPPCASALSNSGWGTGRRRAMASGQEHLFVSRQSPVTACPRQLRQPSAPGQPGWSAR
jgi:hypothetical protein